MARKFTDEDKAKALVALAANNQNVSKTAKLLGIPRKTLSEWANGNHVASVTPEMLEKNASTLADKFEHIAEVLTGAMLDPVKIAKASLKDVSVSAGIAVDKRNLLRSLPTSISAKVDNNLKTQYERCVTQLIDEAAKKGVTVERNEAVGLLEVHIPDIREVIGVH